MVKKKVKSRAPTRFIKYREKKVKVGVKRVAFKPAPRKIITKQKVVIQKTPKEKVKETPIYKTERKLEFPAVKESLAMKVRAPSLKRFKKYLVSKRRVKIKIGRR